MSRFHQLYKKYKFIQQFGGLPESPIKETIDKEIAKQREKEIQKKEKAQDDWIKQREEIVYNKFPGHIKDNDKRIDSSKRKIEDNTISFFDPTLKSIINPTLKFILNNNNLMFAINTFNNTVLSNIRESKEQKMPNKCGDVAYNIFYLPYEVSEMGDVQGIYGDKKIWRQYNNYEDYNKQLPAKQVFDFLRDKNYTLSIKQYSNNCEREPNVKFSNLFKIYVKENEKLSPV